MKRPSPQSTFYLHNPHSLALTPKAGVTFVFASNNCNTTRLRDSREKRISNPQSSRGTRGTLALARPAHLSAADFKVSRNHRNLTKGGSHGPSRCGVASIPIFPFNQEQQGAGTGDHSSSTSEPRNRAAYRIRVTFNTSPPEQSLSCS